MINQLVVGFYGSPGVGKTTAACSLYALLKKTNIPVEMAAEFAKEKVLEKNKMAMSYQKYIWINQCYRIYSAYQTAQVVITDAPILLGAIYNNPLSPALKEVILEEHRQYNHLNIIVARNEDRMFSEVGRAHTLEQARQIDADIVRLLDEEQIHYIKYEEYTEDELVDMILSAIKNEI